MTTGREDGVRLTLAGAALAGVTVALQLLAVSSPSTVSTTYLLIVLVVATTSRLRVAVITSIAAMLSLNFFFLPPIGNFTISDPENWGALVAFLAVSLVASHLSSVARERTEDALERRNEVARLFDLGRDVLQISDSPDALTVLARAVARRFDLEFVAVALPRDGQWDVHPAGPLQVPLDTRELASAFASAQTSLEFDAYSRTYTGHRVSVVDGREVRLVPLRAGTRPIGVLAAAERPVEPGTLDALAGVVAIAVERVRFLGELKAGALARQEEQLKTALLASLSHDLRTPLTAINVAASNLKAGELSPDERREQSDLILSESGRLTRLFENVLDMARIDANAVTSETRWTHVSEIVAAARDQVGPALDRHLVDVVIDGDPIVQLDPRLTASALAHLLENAAQYTPPGAAVRISAVVDERGLVLCVRDHGPGISSADLPRLFERFYRGAEGRSRTSGTGMGLWIVRGLLAAGGGRIWAENCSDGGAQFTMVIPVAVKAFQADALSS
ncbi:MAG TPA: ATP-binding protein [Vicinamibacterales bacterium]|jgi:two-component system sensor histidine kinase KdpD|nr:ATP-binding protein [Vicinamibacterales bacterium]